MNDQQPLLHWWEFVLWTEDVFAHHVRNGDFVMLCLTMLCLILRRCSFDCLVFVERVTKKLEEEEEGVWCCCPANRDFLSYSFYDSERSILRTCSFQYFIRNQRSPALDEISSPAAHSLSIDFPPHFNIFNSFCIFPTPPEQCIEWLA
jgi:hypothetical protein